MSHATVDLVSLIRTGDLAGLREELVQRRPRERADMLAELRAEGS